eukprot:3895849-Prorocentrum_lima.AAC.1
MRHHGLEAVNEVAAMKQSMAHTEIERQRMMMFVEKAEARATEEDRLRRQTLAEAQNIFMKQEQSIQKEKRGKHVQSTSLNGEDRST